MKRRTTQYKTFITNAIIIWDVIFLLITDTLLIIAFNLSDSSLFWINQIFIILPSTVADYWCVCKIDEIITEEIE